MEFPFKAVFVRLAPILVNQLGGTLAVTEMLPGEQPTA
jgi:hypothetical protein